MSDRPSAVGIPRASLLLVAVGGLMALGGTYWDDAFHTHIGRDEFASPPHLLLYAGVVVALAGVWWWAAVARRGGPRAWRTDRALVLAGAGGLTTLASGPIDEVWHTAFGRDAVLWSPPHMLGIVGMLALAAGVLAGAVRVPGRGRRAWIVLAGTAVLGATMIPVMEYEADVPQFAAVWYLPVLTAGMVLAFALIERADRSWVTVPIVAAAYTVLRSAVVGFLAILGYSTPFVPPILVPALVFAATRRLGTIPRALVVTAALVATYAPAMNLVIRGVRLDGADLVVGGGLGLVVAALLLRAIGGQLTDRERTVCSGAVAAAVLAVPLLLPVEVLAHDPGQGELVAPIELTATARADHATLRAIIDHPSCEAVSASSTVARRGGRVRTGPLAERAPCTFEGEVHLDEPGRWFLYVELTGTAGEVIEAWVPITPPDAAAAPRVTEQKADWAYLPAGSDDTSIVQVVGGALVYALAAALLVLTVRTARPASRSRPR